MTTVFSRRYFAPMGRTLLMSFALISFSFGLAKSDSSTLAMPSSSARFNSQSHNQTENVIIYLKYQPVHDLAPDIQAVYRPQFEAQRKQLQAPYAQLEQLQQEGISLTNETAIAAKKAEITTLSQQLETSIQAMRREIIEKARPIVENSQAELLKWLEANGAKVHSQLVVVNAVSAAVPIDRLEELEARPDVAIVAFSQTLTAQLDHSFYAINADVWHDHDVYGRTYEPGVIDTGIDTHHPALDGYTWQERVCLNAAGNPPSDNTPDDLNGHGTVVAGPILSADQFHIGVGLGAATAFNLKAATSLGQMYDADAMDCVNWAMTTHTDPPDVLNLSYGGCPGNNVDYDPFSLFWDSVVDDLLVPVTISAGNYDPQDPCTRNVDSPGFAYNVLTVGNVMDNSDATASDASRTDDVIAPSSSIGPTPGGRRKPDLAAPGTAIYSTSSTWENESGELDDFAQVSGTSIAAPHVAGALLLLEEYGILDPLSQKALLINTAEDKGTPGWDSEYGWGYLDMNQAWMYKDYIFQNTITPNPKYHLYKGPCQVGMNSTLVWNVRADYNYSNYPTLYYPLSDLDLYMFNETTNELLHSDTTAIDNVHRVTCPYSFGSAVVKVDAFSPAFTRPVERYALATIQDYVMSNGPQFYLYPSDYPDTCVGSEVNVILPITNNGDLVAHDVTASMTITNGLTRISGANPQQVGDIWDGLTTNAYWTLRADNPGTYNLPVAVSSSSYGESFNTTGAIHVEVLTTPPSPVLTYPNNNQITTNRQPTFQWNPAIMAKWYKLQVDDDSDFISPEIDTWVSTNSFTPLSEMELDTFYWRVFSWNNCDTSPWSFTWTFTITTNKVYLPMVIKP